MSRQLSFHSTRALASWRALDDDSPAIIATRLALLPGLWDTDPIKAEIETRLLVNEKRGAVTETMLVLWQVPFRFWMDVGQAGFFVTPKRSAFRAFDMASRRLSNPASTRVEAITGDTHSHAGPTRNAPR